jgi:1-deoxy-D-xylulose 5-phosphate reductoisomerase
VSSFSEKILVVSNDGNSILQVYGTDMIGDINQIYITAGGGSFSLAAGSSRNIAVKFASKYSGKKTQYSE